MAGKVVNSSFVLLSKFVAGRKEVLRKPPQVMYANRYPTYWEYAANITSV